MWNGNRQHDQPVVRYLAEHHSRPLTSRTAEVGLAENVWNAVVIFRELQAKGYTGRLSILRDYIRPKWAMRLQRATVPGHQLQSDWAEHRTLIAGIEMTVHFIVNARGFSRRFYFWRTDSKDAQHTDDGLIRSFEWFGGVPEEVLVDNQKVAVLLHRRGSPARFHPRCMDLAGHYGCVPHACRPALAQTKGKDERMVGSVKHHVFVRSRAFDNWAPLDPPMSPACVVCQSIQRYRRCDTSIIWGHSRDLRSEPNDLTSGSGELINP